MNKLPLPIPKKGNYMQNIGAKLKEGFERGAKICVNGALSTVSLLAATMVNPVFGIAFFPTAFNFVRAIQLRTRKDSVFAITKKGNEVYIKQNINLGTRFTYADISATILDMLGMEQLEGISFKEEIMK